MLTRARKGFTLLELIVVLVILGILALIAIPTFSSLINSAAGKSALETAGSLARDANANAAINNSATTIANVAAVTSEVSGATITAVPTATPTGYQVVLAGAATGTACVTINTAGLAAAAAGTC